MQRSMLNRMGALMLLLHALFTFMPGVAAKLCVDSDGHMHLERKDTVPCCSSLGDTEYPTAVQARFEPAPEEAWGPCMDTAFNLDAPIFDRYAHSHGSGVVEQLVSVVLPRVPTSPGGYFGRSSLPSLPANIVLRI